MGDKVLLPSGSRNAFFAFQRLEKERKERVGCPTPGEIPVPAWVWGRAGVGAVFL